MESTPIILVPGFWLGGWAWDDVADRLRDKGHTVVALTLPGLESPDADRSGITLDDHVAAMCNAVLEFDSPVVLAVHSGAGGPGYEVTDRLPDRIARMVYVDSAPATGALDPDFAGIELPMPSLAKLAAEENLDGLSEAQLEEFRSRSVPQPGGALRDAPKLQNDARRDVPTTVICTGFPSDAYKKGLADGYTWLAGLGELNDLTYVDMPTSHWPMWSKPAELADLLSEAADG